MSSNHKHIGGRTLSRCNALQLLFQAEACGRSVADVLSGEYALSEGPLDEYGELLARGTDEHLADIDAVLSGAMRNWSLSRVSATDRNLLRIALYEMLFVDEVAPAVAIDECVELAKAFGSSEESNHFVNGVLGRIQADIDAGVDVVAQAREREAAEASASDEQASGEYEGASVADDELADLPVPDWANEGE